MIGFYETSKVDTEPFDLLIADVDKKEGGFSLPKAIMTKLKSRFESPSLGKCRRMKFAVVMSVSCDTIDLDYNYLVGGFKYFEDCAFF